MRLISKKQAIETTLSTIDSNCESVVGCRIVIRDALNRTPEAVVRCKDCKHYKCEATRCLTFNAPMREDGFCSYGERRTDETD